jgi:exodeoxyribonuclease VII large subunit
LGAAALHDVATALQRRVPHIPVILAPASVQGANAPLELLRSLNSLVAWQSDSLMSRVSSPGAPLAIDVILMVRGGGSMEDLWAFNDEALVRAVAACPIPIIAGVGHETDFTLIDFVADLRAPTPTAAAELVAAERGQLLSDLSLMQESLSDALTQVLDRMSQRLDWLGNRLGRPSGRISDQKSRLSRMGQALQFGLKSQVQSQQQLIHNMRTRLGLLDPHLVLERGYAWLTDDLGQAMTHAKEFKSSQTVTATLADGQVKLQVK